jgi:hypothetical protein
MRLHVCPCISLIDYANGILQGDAFTQLGDSERGAKELIVDCCARHILAQVLICALTSALVCVLMWALITIEVTELTKLNQIKLN